MTYQAQVGDVVIVVVPHAENFQGTITKALSVTNRFGRTCWYVTVKEEGAHGATVSFAQRDLWDGAHPNFTGAKNVIFLSHGAPAAPAPDAAHGEDGTQVFLVMERDNDEYPAVVEHRHTHRTREGAVNRVRALIEAAGYPFVAADEAEWVAGDKEYWIVAEFLGG